MSDASHLVANFFRRWSTMDITAENRVLFEEHLLSVRVLAETGAQRELLSTVHAGMTRAEFSERHRTFINKP